MSMEDDNIFDKDDALDYIIYKENTKEENDNKNKGCLSLVVLIALPFGSLLAWVSCLSIV